MSGNAHDYVLVLDRSERFRSLLKQENHADFEVEWIQEFIRGLRCRDQELNKITTVTIVVYAEQHVSRYTPGAYAAGSSNELRHYWEFLPPTLLGNLGDNEVKLLLKTWVAVTSKLYVEEYGSLNLVLQDLALDGFIRIRKVRHSLFLRRLSLTVTATSRRIRVLVVVTGGRFNHIGCSLDNAFKNREFSGLMKVKSKKDIDAQLAWKSSSCIVAKAVQYVYDYVYINVVGKLEEITLYAEELEQIWSHSTLLKTSLDSFKNGYEDSVYKILEPCAAVNLVVVDERTEEILEDEIHIMERMTEVHAEIEISDTSLSIPSGPNLVSSTHFPPLLVIAIDESDSFNRSSRGKNIQKTIRNWVNSLLRQGKARPKFENFKAIIARFSGLNIKGEDNKVGSQVFNTNEHILYHYELAPKNRNGTLLDNSEGYPYIEYSEIDDKTDVFEPVSDELDGNSQFYLCIRDICHYIEHSDELDNYNKVLLVISDMGFDGIGDSIAKMRPLKDANGDNLDFIKMKKKLDDVFNCAITDGTIFGLQVDVNDKFKPPKAGTLAYKNLATVFDYKGQENPENIFHASFHNFEDGLNSCKDQIANLLFDCLDESEEA